MRSSYLVFLIALPRSPSSTRFTGDLEFFPRKTLCSLPNNQDVLLAAVVTTHARTPRRDFIHLRTIPFPFPARTPAYATLMRSSQSHLPAQPSPRRQEVRPCPNGRLAPARVILMTNSPDAPDTPAGFTLAIRIVDDGCMVFRDVSGYRTSSALAATLMIFLLSFTSQRARKNIWQDRRTHSQ